LGDHDNHLWQVFAASMDFPHDFLTGRRMIVPLKKKEVERLLTMKRVRGFCVVCAEYFQTKVSQYLFQRQAQSFVFVEDKASYVSGRCHSQNFLCCCRTHNRLFFLLSSSDLSPYGKISKDYSETTQAIITARY
jgi:hypothetical protein